MSALRDGLQSALNTGSQYKLLGTGARGTLETKGWIREKKTGDKETGIRRLLLKSRFEVIWAYTKKGPIETEMTSKLKEIMK